MSDRALDDVRRSVLSAARPLVLTGAGASAESGIPTFRGPGGLWREFRPEELATPSAFARDPKLVWEWYDWRRGLVAKAEPHAGHRALAAWGERTPGLRLVTQNVDGLHQRAGSRGVVEFHGSLWRLRCLACRAEAEDRRCPLPELPPRCACGGALRPGVVWFGESLDPSVVRAAFAAAEDADLALVVGTSGVVEPAASLARAAKAAGAAVVEVNAEPTALTSRADWFFEGKAGEVLPRLLAA